MASSFSESGGMAWPGGWPLGWQSGVELRGSWARAAS